MLRQLPGMRCRAGSLGQGRTGPSLVRPAFPLRTSHVRAAASGKGGEGDSTKPSRRRTSSNNGGEEVPPPSPAVQAANNLAKGSSSSSSSKAPPSPAVQAANNLASGASPPAAAAPSGSSSSRGSSSGGAGAPAPSSPADLLQQGIRGAADATEEAIAQAAGAAVGGVEAAASLSQQGLAAAEAAAEQAARGLSDAAAGGLNAAAAAVGSTAGALDGVAAAARGDTPRSRQQQRGGSSSSNGAPAASSADFDTVSVRVPVPAWANATREKGRVRDMTLTQDFDEDEVEQLKVQILAAVASLDRGLAANVREARDVDGLARKLEDAAGPVKLGWMTSRSSPNQSTMERLAGTWRLIYSSGFNGGSLGGSRPGPPAAFTPTVLGQIYQCIDAEAMTLDNVVELLLQYGLPSLPFLSPPEPQPAPGLRATLRHTYEVTPPNSIKIVFESTAVKAIGPELLQSLPQFGLPELPSFLKPPKDLRSATFTVTFLDAGMRVTRGDRGELRIYLKDTPLERKLPIDDE